MKWYCASCNSEIKRHASVLNWHIQNANWQRMEKKSSFKLLFCLKHNYDIGWNMSFFFTGIVIEIPYPNIYYSQNAERGRFLDFFAEISFCKQCKIRRQNHILPGKESCEFTSFGCWESIFSMVPNSGDFPNNMNLSKPFGNDCHSMMILISNSLKHKTDT